MKYRYYFLLLFFLSLSFAAMAQSVGVGTTAPNASAVLDVTSTTGGMLLPRMTAAQRAAIPSPVQGLFVFQTDGTPGLYYYVGNSWVNVVNGLVPDVNGNAGANPTTRVSTLAGSTRGYVDGTGAAAQFYGPSGVAVDGSGTVYVADQYNQRIRKITATGVVSTLAGSGVTNSMGNTPGGYADGTGVAAQFDNPTGVAVDGTSNVYVADQYNQRIRKIVVATGEVTTLAGSTQGYADGTGAAAQFNNPKGVAVDGSGNVYVADQNNHRIRKIVVATGVVSTLAGSTAGYADGTGAAAQFNNPKGVAVDGSGTVYVADGNNQRIRKITATGVVSTVAGTGTVGYAEGTGAAAQFNSPYGVAVDGSGTVYVADQSNNRIRVVK